MRNEERSGLESDLVSQQLSLTPPCSVFISQCMKWFQRQASFLFLFFRFRAVFLSVKVSAASFCTSFLPYLDWWVPGRGCGQADTCAAGHRKPGRRSSCCWSWSHRYSVNTEYSFMNIYSLWDKDKTPEWSHKQAKGQILQTVLKIGLRCLSLGGSQMPLGIKKQTMTKETH